MLAVLVRLKLGRPVLFTQVRPGYRGKPFPMIKFRSMTDGRDASGELLPDEQRLTRLGRFMRSYSLDELPEVVQCAARRDEPGGPRPLLMHYLERYSPEQAPPPRGLARHHRLGAGQRAQYPDMGGEVPPGCLVCRSLVVRVGYPHPVADVYLNLQARGHQPARSCHRRNSWATSAGPSQKRANYRR